MTTPALGRAIVSLALLLTLLATAVRAQQPLPQRQLTHGATSPGRVAAVANGPHAVFGTIVALMRGSLLLRTRHGDRRIIDDVMLRSGDYSSPLFIGKRVLVFGRYDAGGVFHASTMQRISRIDRDTAPDR